MNSSIVVTTEESYALTVLDQAAFAEDIQARRRWARWSSTRSVPPRPDRRLPVLARPGGDRGGGRQRGDVRPLCALHFRALSGLPTSSS